jgi:hypothetical protein
MFRLRLHKIEPGAEAVRAAIKHYGYNIRTLLEVFSGQGPMVEQRIKSKVSDLDIVAIQRMLVADIDSASEASRSHTLIMTLCSEQREPPDKKYLTSDDVARTLVGSFVSRALFQRNGAEFYQRVRFTASLFGSIPRTASVGGCAWEDVCHQAIPKLPHLDLVRMVVDEEKLLKGTRTERISIGHLTHQLYTRNHENKFTADPKKYYIPSATNNATFDAFCRCEGKGIGLQMTLAQTHSLAESGLRMLEDRLLDVKDRYFVFVIRKSQKFACKAPAPEWLSLFHFCTLELDDSKYGSPLLDL